MNNNLSTSNNFNTVATGSGLIALDIIINDTNNKYLTICVGGSCGNVLSILSYFKWLSYPIAYMGKDLASNFIIKDLLYWKVNTNFIYLDDRISTPLIIEKVFNNNTITHKFEFKCPYCGSDLPRNRFIPKKYLSEIIKKMPSSQIFYFDRISKNIIEIAKAQKNYGALIFFEPYKITKERLFKKCLKISHIVKYSGEQIKQIPYNIEIPLEIKTLGASGLKYKLNIDENNEDKWIKLKAYNHNEIIDSAGAGDWCTAGIIHAIGQNGSEGFLNASKYQFKNAIKFGQYLASLKCRYIGARGIMYNIKISDINKIYNNSYFSIKKSDIISKEKPIIKNYEYLKFLCPFCVSNNKK